jgi:hypothetical protein
VGRLLLGSAAIMATGAIACWAGVLPLEPDVRRYATFGLAIVAAFDALVAIRLLAQPD